MAALASDPAAGAARGRPPLVLVVEDEILVRLMVSEYLREAGYAVAEASSGDEALALLETLPASGQPIDLVFSDIRMPGTTDGIALARWVYRNLPDVPVILASAWSEAIESADDVLDGSPLVQKPYKPTEVLERVRLALAIE
jgi:CheY-like chemotaxis protein